MRTIKEVMTRSVYVVPPDASLFDIAAMMRAHDIGAVPVCDGQSLLGMVTDRDIVMKTIGQDVDPKTVGARDIATSPIVYCYEDDDIEEAARIMEVQRIRRLIVLDREKKMQGIVTIGDIAERGASRELIGEIVSKVRAPKSAELKQPPAH